MDRAALHRNNFDLIRLFAAAQVAYLHIVKNLGIELALFPELLKSIFEIFPGVPIFFVTSGYLISASYRRNKDPRRYLIARFLRIYPALWVCTGITLVAILLLGNHPLLVSTSPDGLSIPIMKWLVSQLTIAQFYAPFSIRQAFGVGHPNGSLWTIPVELQFYLLLPIVIVFIDRTIGFKGSSQRALIFFVATSLVAGFYAWAREDIERWNESIATIARVTVFPYLYMFAMGIVLQINWVRIQKVLRGKFLLWLAIYCAVALLFWRVLDWSPNSNTPNLITMSVLALTVLAAAYSKPNLSISILRGNDISYGIYIYHMVIVNMAYELAFPPTMGVGMAVMLVTALTALLSWFLIERPALGLKSRVRRSGDRGTVDARGAVVSRSQESSPS